MAIKYRTVGYSAGITRAFINIDLEVVVDVLSRDILDRHSRNRLACAVIIEFAGKNFVITRSEERRVGKEC